MKVFLTNFDFEVSLSRETYLKPSYNKVSQSFESLYLWSGESDSTLFTEKKYCEDYLKYIEDKRGYLIATSSEQAYTDLWWSNNLSGVSWEIERKINSKETSFQCRKDLGIELPNSFVLEKKEELVSISPPFILKNFFGFSGRGLVFIRDATHKEEMNEPSFPLLVEPLLNRIRDFGVTFDKGIGVIVENLIDQRGQFKGALTKDKFAEEDLILSRTKPIYEWYACKFGIEQLQIDCFQYLENGELKFNALCEVNHRNTMGRVAINLQNEFGGPCSAFVIVSKKKLLRFNTQKERENLINSLDFTSRTGVLTLSPIDADFQVFFLSEESDRALQLLITSWWKKVRSGTDVSLPREFIINS